MILFTYMIHDTGDIRDNKEMSMHVNWSPKKLPKAYAKGPKQFSVANSYETIDTYYYTSFVYISISSISIKTNNMYIKVMHSSMELPFFCRHIMVTQQCTF